MRKQSKKEKEAVDKFKRDTEGMTSGQIFEYVGLSEVEKEKFINKFREHGIRHISQNHIDNKIDKKKINNRDDNKNSKSSLTKKERDKGYRAERIWHRGNDAISHECQCSNVLRNVGQYLERSNYFKNRDLLIEKRKTDKDIQSNQRADSNLQINKKNRYIYHNDLDKFKDKVEFEIDDNGVEKDKYKIFRDAYHSMTMACLAQQTLVLVADSWESYFEGLFGFLRGDPNYTGMPKIPGYGDKGGEYIVVIPNNQFKIVSGHDVEKSWNYSEKKVNTLAFEPGLHYLKLDGLETRLTDNDNIREIRIIPAGVGYFIEIVYKLKEDERKKELLTKKNGELIKLNYNIIGGIDLGLRNFATIGFAELDMVSGSGKVIGQPICFNGGILKSINQYYNKIRAEIQSVYEKQCKKLKTKLRRLKFQYKVKTQKSDTSKELKDKLYKEIQFVKGELKKIRTGPAITKLTFERNNKMMDLMHKYSRDIIDRCIEMRAGILVIGHNKGQKQSIELGGITNQNFVFIPFFKLIKMIKYKAEEVGILVVEQEESYTSKCSFPDHEDVCKKADGSYIGKRISRGLFRSKNGIIINADVNGVFNIIRKYLRKAFPEVLIRWTEIEGVRLHPVRVNPLG